jgi:radical S-adenosyl methionine domain-containing protein 2
MTRLTHPVAVNFHIWPKCNLACTFCYATFPQARRTLPLADALSVIDKLTVAGASKITFVGGEPTLYPHLAEVVRHASENGLTTCIVSNGARLRSVLERSASCIDWVGLSVDSADEAVQQALGRGKGDHVANSIEFGDLIRGLGIRLKLNTVVTALNWKDDMAWLVRRLQPDRWKAFQVLRVEDENAGRVEPLLISDAQFRAFADRHAHLAGEGFPLVAETNDDIRGSYVMIDPLGRFFSNEEGRYRISQPILDVGVKTALEQSGWRSDKFLARGGLYDWAGQQDAEKSLPALLTA